MSKQEKCKCTDHLCSKCLLVKCKDDKCHTHTLTTKLRRINMAINGGKDKEGALLKELNRLKKKIGI